MTITIGALLERVRDTELEQERLGDAVCDLKAADEEMAARLDAANQQHAALVARVMGMGDVAALMELVHNIDARLRALEVAGRHERQG